jgi:hypothetical protein
VCWVDDISYWSTEQTDLELFAKQIYDEYGEAGPHYPTQFLGLNVTQNDNTIHISSRALIERAGKRFFPKNNPFRDDHPVEEDPDTIDLTHVKTTHAKSPFPSKGSAQGTESGGVQIEHQPKEGEPRLDKPFRELLGVIAFCAVTTRIDIAWHVSQLGRIQNNPGKKHWDLAKHVLRYLIRTKDYGPCYTTNNDDIQYYTDASWGDIPPHYIPETNLYTREGDRYLPVKGRKFIDPKDPDGRRSSFGYTAILAGAPISWQSQVQKTRRALSTTESELYAATFAAKDLIHVRGILQDMGLPCSEPITIHEDNQSCINQILREGISSRTKHIELRFYYLRDLETEGVTAITYCPTEHQLADILTKNTPETTFTPLRDQLIRVAPQKAFE